MKAITFHLSHSVHRFLSPRGLALVAFLLLLFALSQPARAISPDDQSAREAALQWLGLIDSGHYRQAFEQWPARLQAATMGGVDHFVKWMQTRRTPLGHPWRRAFYKVSAYHNANGWPDGNYQQIDFKTTFERKA
jgi:hypothetical protein